MRKRHSWARLIYGLLVGLATGYLAAREFSEWRPTEWYAHENLVWVASFAIGSAAAREVVGGFMAARREDRTAAFCRELDKLAIALWVDLQEELPSYLAYRLAIHIWLVPLWHRRLLSYKVRRTIPAPVRRRLPTPPMWLPSKVLLIDDTVPTNVDYRRGVGVPGRCWLEREPIRFRVDEQWEFLSTPSAAIVWERSRANESLAQRLSYRQARAIRKNSGQIFAMPIWKPISDTHAEFAGCIVVELPPQSSPGSRMPPGKVMPQSDILTDEVERLLSYVSKRIAEKVQ